MAAAEQLSQLWEEKGGRLLPAPMGKLLKAVELQFAETLEKLQDVQKLKPQNKCHTCPKKEEHLRSVILRRECVEDIKDLEHCMRDASLQLYDDMGARLAVLRARGFIDETQRATLKGRVAQELMTSDELSLAEALFENVLQETTPEEAAALLSAYVVPEKFADCPMGPSKALTDGRATMEHLHGEIEKLQHNLRVRVDSDDYWRLCNFGLSFAIYDWARGVPFAEIMAKKSDDRMQEGGLVRAVLRLYDLLIKVQSAARMLGEERMEKLVEEAAAKLKRDIAFSGSLYLQ
eukprot:GHVU01191232.1.p1 GENE.GHVU01191232.1~~GHVU01191232.1.p1  ORF type:complete len:327 (-),score=100.63 GHVU01191232.1:120-992(-)